MNITLLLACRSELYEKEPENDTQAGSTVIGSGQKIKGSYYKPKGTDKDYYRIGTNKATMLSGEISGVRGVDPILFLYQIDKPKPIKIINDAQSSSGETFGPLLIQPPGAYLLVTSIKPMNNPEYKENFFYELTVNTSTPPEPSEIEPNDSFNQAQNLEETITGYYSNVYISNAKGIATDIEKDVFRLRLPEKRKYRLSANLTGVSGIDAILRLYDKDKKQVLEIDDKALGQGESIENFGITGPTVAYLVLNAKDYRINTKDYYSLHVNFSEHENKYEFEPNDSKKTASKISETNTHGEIFNGDDIDYFLLHNTTDYPQVLNIVIHPHSDLDIMVKLIPKNNKKSIVYNDAKAGEKEGIANMTINPDQKIYLRLSAVNFEGPNALPYEIETSWENILELSEIEPNNDPKNATEIVPGTTVLGYINPNDDIDYYRLNTDKDQYFNLEIDSLENCKLQMNLLDKKGIVFKKYLAPKVDTPLKVIAKMEAKGFIRVSCQETTENLFPSQYKLSVLPKENNHDE